MKNNKNKETDLFRAIIRPFKTSLLGKETWRDPDKKPYKILERFMGLRRVLIPLWFLLEIVMMLLLNYIFSLPQIISSVFAGSIFEKADYGRIVELRYFFNFPRNESVRIIYFFVLFLLSVFSILKLYKYRRGYAPLEETQTAATSRWATNEELESQYHTMATDELDSYDGPSGVPIGTAARTREDIEKNRVREFISDEATNTGLVGETRAGKGLFGIEKAIDGFSRTINMKLKKSMNIHDPSGELYLKWKKLLEQRGYVVKLLNLVDTAISDSTNPLALVVHYYRQYLFAEKTVDRDRGLDQAQAELASLCYSYFHDENAKEPFWQDAAAALFTASSQALIEESLLTNQEELSNLYTILNMIAEMNSERLTNADHPYLVKYEPDYKERQLLFKQYKDKSVLDFYFEQLPPEHPARIAYQDILASAPAKVTIGNVVTHTLTKMKAFRRTGNAKLTSLNTIDFMQMGFGEKPMAVFVVVSDQDPSNHSLAANYFDQSFKELHKAGLREPSRKLPREVVYVYEEAGNMVNIPNLHTKVTDGLKVGISHYIVVQNHEQLNKYGESNAATIISNCGNWIVIKTKSKQTRETIMDDLGNKANLSLSRQGKVVDEEKTHTESVERIPMMTKDALSRMPFGQTIAIRTMKTHDLEGNVIMNLYPILNAGETRMVESYKYIPYQDSTWTEIEELYADAKHVSIDLKDLLYKVKVEEIPYKEERRQAIKKGEKFIPPKQTNVNEKNGNEENPPIDRPDFDEFSKNAVAPKEENKKLRELDDIFDTYFKKDKQMKPIKSGLETAFVNRVAREVRNFYQKKPRIVNEFDDLRETGTVKDLKDWLSNVGREPLYGKIIEIVEMEGLM